MDITIQIMKIDKSHTPDGGLDHRLSLGYIVNIYRRADVVEPPSENNPTVFIHCKNCPLSMAEVHALAHAEFDEGKGILHKRKWRFVRTFMSDIPPVKRAELVSDRETTMFWSRVKLLIRRTGTGATWQR